MNLAECAKNLLDALKIFEKQSSIERLEQTLETAIIECNDPDEIEQMLAVDEKLYLPDQIRTIAFEQLLALGRRTWRILAGYGAHLSMYYPVESEEGQRSIQLLEEARRLKQEEKNLLDN